MSASRLAGVPGRRDKPGGTPARGLTKGAAEMKGLSFLALSVALLVSVGARGDDETTEVRRQLRGEWVVVDAERDGEKAKDFNGLIYQFADGKLTMRTSDPKKVETRSARFEVQEPNKPG